MKIERISDTQVKFYFTNEDLHARNIKISELAFGSEKAQAFFREITEQAADTCGFTADNDSGSIPLMVEAMPISDGIMIIVSKVNDINDLQSHIDKKLSGKGPGANAGQRPTSFTERHFKEAVPDTKTYLTPADDEHIEVYRFESFDDAQKAVRALRDAFLDYTCSSLVLCDKTYYLLINTDDIINMNKAAFNGIINQYGCKNSSNSVALAYLKEYGEVLIKSNAVKILSEF